MVSEQERSIVDKNRLPSHLDACSGSLDDSGTLQGTGVETTCMTGLTKHGRDPAPRGSVAPGPLRSQCGRPHSHPVSSKRGPLSCL